MDDRSLRDMRYAHNPQFCMIAPSAEEEEGIVSAGQS